MKFFKAAGWKKRFFGSAETRFFNVFCLFYLLFLSFFRLCENFPCTGRGGAPDWRLLFGQIPQGAHVRDDERVSGEAADDAALFERVDAAHQRGPMNAEPVGEFLLRDAGAEIFRRAAFGGAQHPAGNLDERGVRPV